MPGRRGALAGVHPAVRLGTAVLGAGVAAGVGGALLTLLLHAVQHLAYGYVDEAFVVGSQQASGPRRVLAMTVGGLVVGGGWWALRRWHPGGVSVTGALARPARRLRMPTATADAVLQITAVGAGASLGREGAPRQLAAAAAEWLARRLDLTAPQRRTLIACGAGAGLAAVYNVPLGGALFTLEVLLRSAALTDALPALLAAGIATAVAWPVVGTGPTYGVPRIAVSGSLVVGALLLGPFAGLAGAAFRWLTTAARERAPEGWRLPVATTLAFAGVGGIAVVVPLVLGNGKGPASLAFTGGLAVATLAVLVVVKPLATAACLAGGAVGGLLTPSVALGAALGGLAGTGWTQLWPGSTVGALAVVGGGAVLAVTQRAPLTAVALTLEFTHGTFALVAPLALATAGALAVATGLPRLAGRASRIVAGRPHRPGRR